MAAAGSAIGLGTLWKFPYMTGQNGGGLFVLTYLLCTFVIGIPVFVAELMLGRKAQRGAVGIFMSLANHSPIWKLAGWLGVIVSFLIISYYSVVAGWGLNYVLMSLNKFYVNRSAEEIYGVFDLLHKSGDICMLWHFIFMAITVAVVLQGVRKGIEFWSRIMTSGLLVLFVGLFIYATTLDGFGRAVHFIFYPDFSKFTLTGALEALGLSFFTLSLGQGIMLTYGSYMKSTEDIPQTALIVGGMDIAVSLLSALMIFPIIFTFGFEPAQGTGLVFQTLPVLFARLPGALIISTLFFTLFVFTALTSAVALVEVVVANFIDLFDWSRRKATLIVGIAAFVVGIPSALSGSQGIFVHWKEIYGIDFFGTVNVLVDQWLLPLSGFMVAVFMGWVLPRDAAYKEFMSGTKLRFLFWPWMFLTRWVAPLAIIIIILGQLDVIRLDIFSWAPAE